MVHTCNNIVLLLMSSAMDNGQAYGANKTTGTYSLNEMKYQSSAIILVPLAF